MRVSLRDPILVAGVLLLAWGVGIAWFVGGRLVDTQAVLASDVALEATPGGVSVSEGAGDPIEVVIEPGTGADEIASLLVRRGVLEDSGALDTLLTFSGIGDSLQAGRYEFPAGLPAGEVIRRLAEGLTADTLLAVPEGLRNEEVGALVVDAGVGTMESWEAALQQPRSRPFLASRPEGASLLGYLLPASYPVGTRTTASEMVEAMLEAFASQVTPDLIAEAEAAGMTLHEVLTLASIVEREAVVAEEQPLVASTFLNRLEVGLTLGADPTVQFAVATPESVEEHGWWKRELTVDDLAVDSPYNTYVYAGLPPGPIANPGIEAIRAVVQPAETEYLYFVASPECDGTHLFAETEGEHFENVALFRASPCGGGE